MGKSIERKIVEEKLSPYGFRYAKYQYCRWTFSRIVNDITQNVVIQKGIWGGGSYRLELDTSINPGVIELSDLSEEARYVFNQLEYSNEEERKAVLEEICDVVIKYGIERLNTREAWVPKRHEITQEMNKKLFEENMFLSEKFMEKNKMLTLNKREVFPALRKELGEICGRPYEQIQDNLVEMAAVYGNMLIDITGGEWKYDGELATIEKDSYFLAGYPPLRFLTWSWEAGKIEVLIREYVREINSLKKWIVGCLNSHTEEVLFSNGWTKENIKRLMEEPLEELEAERELNRQLYQNHEALAREGAVFFGIQDMDGIEAIQRIICKMQELKDEPLKSIIHELLMASAAYGEIFCKVSHGEWEGNEKGSCVVTNNVNSLYEPLKLISCWINGEYEGLIDRYKYAKKRMILDNMK